MLSMTFQSYFPQIRTHSLDVESNFPFNCCFSFACLFPLDAFPSHSVPFVSPGFNMIWLGSHFFLFLLDIC